MVEHIPVVVDANDAGKGGSPKPDPTPDDATLATELPALINMEGMLTLGAIDAILGNADDLFPKEKNIYHADFLGGKRREYFNWDLDSVIGQVDYDIYTFGKWW